MTDTHKERFLVEFSIEGSVEVLLPPTATEKQIDKAALHQICEDFRKARGIPFDVNIGRTTGPY